MTASDATVRYAVSDKVARITLARPPVNAMSLEMIRAIVAALRRAADDRAARVVVLDSAVARYFCAGLDLGILLGQSGEVVREFLQELYVNLYDAQHDLAKPSIAAVGGAARGGGMTLAVSCDVIYAGESASFGYPEIDVGMLPAIHYANLPRLIGRHRAFELLFSGRPFAARAAYDLGIVNRVVPDAELDAAVLDLAAQFAAKSEIVVRIGRAAFMRQNDRDYRRDIAAAVEDFCNVAVSEAGQEGLRAFVEKRRPNW
jgi:enoyl-CoA hydratase/carnithine racemase